MKKLLFCFNEMEIFRLEGEYSQPVADPKCIFPKNLAPGFHGSQVAPPLPGYNLGEVSTKNINGSPFHPIDYSAG